MLPEDSLERGFAYDPVGLRDAIRLTVDLNNGLVDVYKTDFASSQHREPQIPVLKTPKMLVESTQVEQLPVGKDGLRGNRVGAEQLSRGIHNWS